MKNTDHLRSSDGKRTFDYFAFISYKHADKKYAVWLQNQLESYRLPSRLCKSPRRPKRLCPVCRDGTDFKGGHAVQDEICAKIAQSKFLIVLCSRNMQQSPEYINAEIEAFLAQGNPVQHILPFVVDGEGCAADPRNEAFPPALLAMGDARPLGITLDRKKRRHSILTLVATMQGIEIRSLRDHDHDRRQKRFISFLTAGLLLSLLLGLMMTWSFLSVKQAQLREQNLYAWEDYEQGDRLQAQTAAARIAAQPLPFVDASIVGQAEKTRWLASIHPAFSPVTLLEDVRSDKTVFFDTTGNHVVIQTADRVRTYALTGELVRDCPASLFGQKYVTVSPDGNHAVVLTAFEGSAQVTLWLCSLETGERIRPLVSSNRFDRTDLSAGRYDSIVDATFSPDGRYVAAYRTGGYYNRSETLTLHDGKTGAEVAVLDAALLGTSGQGSVVQAFEFVDSSTALWTGPDHFVLHRIDTNETSHYALRDMAVSSPSHRAGGHLFLTASLSSTGETTVSVFDLEGEVRQGVFPLERAFHEGNSGFFGGHYACLSSCDAEGYVRQLLLVDTDTMRAQDITPLFCKHSIVRVMSDASGQIHFLHLSGGKTGANKSMLIRLDARTGASQVYKDAGFLSPMIYLGHRDGADWLLAPTASGDQTAVFQLQGEQVRQALLDEPYDAIFGQALINDAYLIAPHEEQYALFPLQDPGIQIDAQIIWPDDGVPCFAVSEDGRIVVKAKGQTIAAFENGQCLWQSETQYQVLSAAMSADGSRIVYADARTLYLADRNGPTSLSLPIDAAYRIAVVQMTPQGDRIVIAESLQSQDLFNPKQEARLRILDGQTLEELAIAEWPIYDESGDAKPVFALSPDGERIAAVAVLPGNGPPRIVALFSARTGRMLARSDNHSISSQCPVLDMSVSGVKPPAFTYVHFTRDGQLLAGMDAGVWTIDPVQRKVLAFTATGEAASSPPDKLPNGDLLYTARDLCLLREGTGERLATIPAGACARSRLSQDGKWVILQDGDGVHLISTDDPQICGTFANTSATLLYLDANLAVYHTASGLHLLNLQGGNE